MRKIAALFVLVFLLMGSSPSWSLSITGKPFLDEQIWWLLENNVLDDRYSDGTDIGDEICKAYGGSGCWDLSIGDGICKAGGGSGCWDLSIGDGICKAGGGSGCWDLSISEGLAKLPRYDVDWDWDQFYHSTGSLVWACRGIQTGQFADLYRCSGKSSTFKHLT